MAMLAVLQRGRNFGRKTQKGPEKSGDEYLPDLSKKGRKGAELFLKFKIAKFLTEN
jgi:hypothetical protein